MKFLIFVGAIFTLVYGVSADTCQSTNDGSACLAADDPSYPSWYNNYSGGETCFAWNGGTVRNTKTFIFQCITLTTNLVA